MEMMKKMMLMAGVSLMVMACGNSQSGATYQKVDKSATESDVNNKLSQEYIALRIDSFYLWQNDSLCCTQSYLALDRKAQEVSKNRDEMYRDADHWVMGQDVSGDWSYELQSVQFTSDSAATAKVNVHNFTDQEVYLDLRYERDDWYVDNFRMVYEGTDYDADGNVIPETEGIKEMNERECIQNFLQSR